MPKRRLFAFVYFFYILFIDNHGIGYGGEGELNENRATVKKKLTSSITGIIFPLRSVPF
jgi:hypothetical protein